MSRLSMLSMLSMLSIAAFRTRNKIPRNFGNKRMGESLEKNLPGPTAKGRGVNMQDYGNKYCNWKTSLHVHTLGLVPSCGGEGGERVYLVYTVRACPYCSKRHRI